MSITTEKDIRNLLIYQVFLRNHTQEGTFAAFENDLDRIKDLGVDFVYFLPIHEIGQKKRKGTLGSPYSIKDYRSINHELGTLEDFQHVVKEIHDRGMKVMIDIVFNHTSYDSKLLKEHPEYFYRNEDGDFANRVGDWWDITDFDYTNDIGLWEELIDTLLYWVRQGVDGFRWDVTSFLPLQFLDEAHERVLDENPNFIFLSESIHGGFLRYIRNQGYKALSESEIYQVFDIAYEYDVEPYRTNYLKGEGTLKRYVEEVERQEEIYPDNYVKLRNLENHDNKRIAFMVNNDEDKIYNWTAAMFFQKGCTMVYAGQEFCDQNTPSLFDKDLVNWDGKDISPFIKTMAEIAKDKTFSYGFHDIIVRNEDVLLSEYRYLGKRVIGLFNVGLESGSIEINVPDGTYKNVITGNTIKVTDSKIVLSNEPMIFWV